MTPPRFVVGTGRCGSTLLSRMLGEHTGVTAIHEFFTGLGWGGRFDPGTIAGPALVDLLAADQPVTTKVLARGITSDEIRYPFDRPGARYRRGDAVPWLVVSCLPRLTDDPDQLFDELLSWCADRPAVPLGAHYAALFDRLAGGGAWVERSGSSVDYLDGLLATFPDARIVHLHRDGPETALSIRSHPFYRLAVAVLFDLFPSGGTEDEQIDHVLATAPPLEAVGTYWSDQVRAGVTVGRALPVDRYVEIRFEDLLTGPAEVLTTVADFFELPTDTGFTERAASLVGPAPDARLPALTREDQRVLREACAPGQELLGRGS